MNVIKRDNTIQGVDFNKITERIQNIVKEGGTVPPRRSLDGTLYLWI